MSFFIIVISMLCLSLTLGGITINAMEDYPEKRTRWYIGITSIVSLFVLMYLVAKFGYTAGVVDFAHNRIRLHESINTQNNTKDWEIENVPVSDPNVQINVFEYKANLKD